MKTFLCAVFLTGIAAHAGSITIPLTTVVETSPTVGGNLVLPQFNSSLGTLTGVTLDFLPGSISVNIAISDFETPGPISIAYDLGYSVSFDIFGGGLIIQDVKQLQCISSAIEVAACDDSATIGFPTSDTPFDLTPQLALFLSGPVLIPYAPSVTQNPVVTPVPVSPSHLVLTVSGNVTVPSQITFQYTAAGVPEPGTFLLLGSVLAGLWLALRKRSRDSRT
jgi:hypothetical protein